MTCICTTYAGKWGLGEEEKEGSKKDQRTWKESKWQINYRRFAAGLAPTFLCHHLLTKSWNRVKYNTQFRSYKTFVKSDCSLFIRTLVVLIWLEWIAILQYVMHYCLMLHSLPSYGLPAAKHLWVAITISESGLILIQKRIIYKGVIQLAIHKNSKVTY